MLLHKVRFCTTAFLCTRQTDGHLGYFQILAIVNNAAVSIGVHSFFELVFLVSLDIFPVVESLGQMLVVFKPVSFGGSLLC